MVSGTYGSKLVEALDSFSTASGHDPDLLNQTPIEPLVRDIGKKPGKTYHLQTLPLEYQPAVKTDTTKPNPKMDVTLITLEGTEDRLLIHDSDLRPDLDQMVQDHVTQTQEESPSQLDLNGYLLKRGPEAFNIYERLRKNPPLTVSHLRAKLRTYLRSP